MLFNILFSLFVYVSYFGLANSFEADISLIVIDLKYNKDDGIKICELQPGSVSMFDGYDYAFGNLGTVAVAFDAYLSLFFTGPKFIFRDITDPEFKKKAVSVGWIGINQMEDLYSHPKFKKAHRVEVNNASNLDSYSALLYIKPDHFKNVQDFQRRNPGILITDLPFYRFAWDKKAMNTLFSSDQRLKVMRPQWKAYKKHYSESLVHTILNDFNQPTLVIKPITGTRGRGIIICKREEVKKHLQYILTDDKIKLRNHEDETFSYWGQDVCDEFLIEEFIASDPIVATHLENKIFDPTMRVVAFLSHTNGKIDVFILDGYWKLPEKSLYDMGSLTKKHKSLGDPPNWIAVDSKLMQKIEGPLKRGLSLFYYKTLNK